MIKGRAFENAAHSENTWLVGAELALALLDSALNLSRELWVGLFDQEVCAVEEVVAIDGGACSVRVLESLLIFALLEDGEGVAGWLSPGVEA
jgi:hypothetical protein